MNASGRWMLPPIDEAESLTQSHTSGVMHPTECHIRGFTAIMSFPNTSRLVVSCSIQLAAIDAAQSITMHRMASLELIPTEASPF